MSWASDIRDEKNQQHLAFFLREEKSLMREEKLLLRRKKISSREAIWARRD